MRHVVIICCAGFLAAWHAHYSEARNFTDVTLVAGVHYLQAESTEGVAEALHLSEGAAYMRITTARAARRFPTLLSMLADGRVHVSGVARLAAHLTDKNHETVLSRATYLSKRGIEELVAELAPKPDIRSSMRKLQM